MTQGIEVISVFCRELDKFIKRVRVINDILTVPETSHLTRSPSVMEKVLAKFTDCDSYTAKLLILMGGCVSFVVFVGWS